MTHNVYKETTGATEQTHNNTNENDNPFGIEDETLVFGKISIILMNYCRTTFVQCTLSLILCHLFF